MNEIKCPKCKTLFSLEESYYESILTQIKNKAYDDDLKKLEEKYKKEKDSAIELSIHKFEKEQLDVLNKKDLEIASLKTELKHMEHEVTVSIEKTFLEKLNQKELEIQDLQNRLQLQEKEHTLSLQDTMLKKEQEIHDLKSKIELYQSESILHEKNMKESYEEKLKAKDEQIAYYKDFKARQSTKMIGESLEVHCHNEFNRLRPLFKQAYFEKDNDIKTGSKGDFIFRDYDEEGLEFISIMFEMKNETDETSTKHKNEDFLKELDKDRKEKKCEYAVLVSLLEIDNELYNEGIVDMSYKYPKMYVIRPQFFIPIITLIRNLAMNSLAYKKELEIVRNENIDISHFEENMESFKKAFGRNYQLASQKFQKAIDEIDKTIDHLQKTKEALISSENNLRLANHKAEDLTIKKLTSNSETMKRLFQEEKMKKEYEKL